MKQKKRKKSYRVCYALIIVLAVFVLVCTALSAVPAGASESVRSLDETVIEELKSIEAEDVGEVVAKIRSVEESREESVRQSVSESESIEESIRISSIEEENSIAASIAESVYESSVAEASKQAEWDALTAPLAGSHLVPGKVLYTCDDTDIPYLRALFGHCIVIGDSRAKNAVDCGIFTSKEIVFYSGWSVDQITPYALEVAGLYYPKTLFIVGLNDIAHYNSSNARFKEDLYAMVKQYKEINPRGIVYLQEVIPMPDDEVTKRMWYRHFMIPDFTKRIQEVGSELGCPVVSASDYADPKYINSEDHAHYGKEFYFLWAQTIANQMHLWEDLAGLSYEVDYETHLSEGRGQ